MRAEKLLQNLIVKRKQFLKNKLQNLVKKSAAIKIKKIKKMNTGATGNAIIRAVPLQFFPLF